VTGWRPHSPELSAPIPAPPLAEAAPVATPPAAFGEPGAPLPELGQLADLVEAMVAELELASLEDPAGRAFAKYGCAFERRRRLHSERNSKGSTDMLMSDPSDVVAPYIYQGGDDNLTIPEPDGAYVVTHRIDRTGGAGSFGSQRFSSHGQAKAALTSVARLPARRRRGPAERPRDAAGRS
jgi:hypothetical protein